MIVPTLLVSLAAPPGASAPDEEVEGLHWMPFDASVQAPLVGARHGDVVHPAQAWGPDGAWVRAPSSVDATQLRDRMFDLYHAVLAASAEQCFAMSAMTTVESSRAWLSRAIKRWIVIGASGSSSRRRRAALPGSLIGAISPVTGPTSATT